MRNVLTIVAVALVALMSAALVAPRLVDWSAHRGEIEARLSAILGANISLTGPVDVSLLPSPYLALGEGSVSAPGGPKLSFASARLELALVKLASGQIRFSDIRLEKPFLTVARGADGVLRLPVLPPARLQSIGFDRLIVQDGRLRIVSDAGGAASEINGIEIDAAVPALDGPARLSGQFSGPNKAPVVFTLASEKPGPDGAPLRAEVDAGPNWPAAEFDGALQGDAAGGLKGLRLVGALTLTGTAPGEDHPTPWRIAGPMTLDLRQATLRGAEFRLGPEERAIRASGDAAFVFGSPARLKLTLKAKQANVDAFLRRKGEDAVPPARALTFLSRAVSALQARGDPIAVEAHVSASPIILGAQTLSDAAVALAATPGAPLGLRFDLGLPGPGRLRGEGDLEPGAAANFHGDVDFSSSDFALLRAWAALGAPRVAAVGDALPYRSASLSGAVDASASGFSGRNLKMALDRTTLTGSVSFAGPAGGQAGRLTVDLASNSLDVDSLPSLSVGAKALSDFDFSISLSAGSLHIARVGEAEIDSGSMSLRATKRGPNVTLEHLTIAGLDGASVDIQGAKGRDSIAAMGRLRADRLHDFAALVSRLAPGPWSRILVERAAELSPASLSFEAHGDGDASDAPAIDSLKANGSAGETQFTIALDQRPNDKGRAVTLTLDSPNSGALLRQLGVKGAATGNGRAHISLNASGGWDQGFDVDVTSSLAGSELTWRRGRFVPEAEPGEARLFGAATVKTPNIVALLAALGLAPANGGAAAPAAIAFDATLRGDRWTFSRLAATIAGAKVGGGLTFRPTPTTEVVAEANAELSRAEAALDAGTAAAVAQAPQQAELVGELTVDRMPLRSLLALALGPAQPGKSGARWTDARFAPMPLRPPVSAITLKVATLDATDALPAEGFTTALRLDKGRLDLNDLTMQVAGGSASGHATLRRDADTATLTGTLALDSVAVTRPGFSGRVSGSVDFASTGRSPAALIDGLAGAGTVKFADAALAGSDLGALDRVVAKAQAQDAPLDETNIAYAFGAELGKGALAIPDGPAPVSLSAGELKLGPVAIDGPRGDAKLTADLNLRKLAVETKLVISSSSAGLKFWSGSPPSATVDVQDAFESPRRQIDVSSLSASLAAQAIARETDRIAALEADIRERAYFNRRLKGERFMDRRRQEIEDWENEQTRLKGLAEHLRVEEEADKAAEAQAEANKAAADKAAADKAATENGGAVRAETQEGGPAAAPRPPFAPAANGARSDELGANAPSSTTPAPPVRPKARSAPGDPTERGLY